MSDITYDPFTTGPTPVGHNELGGMHPCFLAGVEHRRRVVDLAGNGVVH
ncbi:hypothetical protein [Corynebacterium durum]